MILEAAESIYKEFGHFLEFNNGSLIMLFLGQIPQSLLPYPKDKIEEALNTALVHFNRKGDKKAIETLKASMALLTCYIDDTQAIKHAIKIWQNEEAIKAIMSNLGNSQKKSFNYLLQKLKKVG